MVVKINTRQESQSRPGIFELVHFNNRLASTQIAEHTESDDSAIAPIILISSELFLQIVIIFLLNPHHKHKRYGCCQLSRLKFRPTRLTADRITNYKTAGICRRFAASLTFYRNSIM